MSRAAEGAVKSVRAMGRGASTRCSEKGAAEL